MTAQQIHFGVLCTFPADAGTRFEWKILFRFIFSLSISLLPGRIARFRLPNAVGDGARPIRVVKMSSN